MSRARIDWDEGGTPLSAEFGDIYFSRIDGLEETRAVYLQGCGLPEAWAGRRQFVVGELGFGLGLNIAALLNLWLRTRPADAMLQIFSIEAFLPARQDAARALSAWPELADEAAALLAAWPAPRRGFHRIDLPGHHAILDLAVLEAGEALSQWSGRADAWFLDGFSPARNPQMWRDDVLGLVAARSAPGARAATFTVAGAVRRGLAAAGFEVEKRPGFGGKAERLEARVAGAPAPETADRPRVAIVGAGIAGASLARAFAAVGVGATVIDAIGPAAGASGNAAALVTPRLDAGGGPSARLHAQAFDRAVDLIDRTAPDAIIARGVLQLETTERDGRRFDALARSEVYRPGGLSRADETQASGRLGERAGRAGLLIADGLVVEPAALIGRWLEQARLLGPRVLAIAPADGGWRVETTDGAVEADIVCLAAGFDSAGLSPRLSLEPVRGQATCADGAEAQPVTASAYVIPTRTGVLFGASHERGVAAAEARAADDAENLSRLSGLRPQLAEALRGQPLEGRAGVRAATPDHLPLVGALADGLFVVSGLGGRGFTLAPLLAEHIAATALGAPSPLPADLGHALHPRRFEIPLSGGRGRRRPGGSPGGG